MEWGSTLLKILVVIILVLNTFSTGAIAQNSPRHVLLDDNPTRMATVHTNSQAFVIYEYDNLLPYASGIEVYTGGERVTSADTVDEVFRALARRQATKFEPESRTIERLQRVMNRSEAVQRATGEAISSLNETLAYRETLQETTVNNTTAWEAAIQSSDALDQSFVSGFSGPSDAGELRNQLMAVRSSARNLETNASRVITLLQQRQAGQEINRSDLYRRYAGVYTELETLKTQLESVQPTILEIANASKMVASQSDSVPSKGEEIQRRFTSLGQSLEVAGNQITQTGPAFTELRTTLPTVATDENYQAQLTKRWKQRQGAATKVYATVAEGVILSVALVLGLFETRS